MRQTIIEALTWALTLGPATLKWPAAVLLALGFGLVLFGLVQYQAFNRLWGLHLVLGLAGGAVVVGLGAASHWLLGVLYGLGYVLTWLVWVLTRRWRWWRRALARGLTAGLALGPWLCFGATELGILAHSMSGEEVAGWLVETWGFRLAFMLPGIVWAAVLVAGWGCWRSAPGAKPSVWHRVMIAAWVLLSALGLNWYAAGRVDLFATCAKPHPWRLAYVLVSRPGSARYPGESTAPLHLVCRNGNATGVSLLLAAGAAVDPKDKHGNTPLHLAIRYGYLAVGYAAVTDLLLAAGADVNAKDNDGGTPLHWAGDSGNAAVLRLLLDAGARVNERNAKGETVLDVAGDDKCRDVLRQAGGKTGAELDAEKAAGGGSEALRP